MRCLIAVLLATAILAACGTEAPIGAPVAPTAAVPIATATSTPSPTPTPTATATATSTRVPSATPTGMSARDRELAAALLTVDDLPAGWAVDIIEEGDDSGARFCDAERLDEAIQATAGASAAFKLTDDGPFLSERISEFPSETTAQQAIAYVREAFSCSEWSTTEMTGYEITFTLTPLEIPAVGDETFGVRITTVLALVGPLVFDAVYFRDGPRVAYVGYFGFLDLDRADTAAFAASAYANMAPLR